MVTSHDIYPEEIKSGVRCKIEDLVTHQVEPDKIIPHQVDSANLSVAEVHLEDISLDKGIISITKTVLAVLVFLLSIE